MTPWGVRSEDICSISVGEAERIEAPPLPSLKGGEENSDLSVETMRSSGSKDFNNSDTHFSPSATNNPSSSRNFFCWRLLTILTCDLLILSIDIHFFVAKLQKNFDICKKKCNFARFFYAYGRINSKSRTYYNTYAHGTRR